MIRARNLAHRSDMNRKLVGGLVALVVALVAVWFLWLRGDGDKPKPAGGSGRTAEITPSATPPANPDEEADAPRAMAPRWSLDLDPAGPIRLEGQVVGPDGKGVAGAEVWLSSVPPRTAKAEEDGTFSFDKLVGRTYALSAKSGALIGGMTYKLTASSDPVVIRLGEGATVVVSVVDEGKRPVANAEVRSGDAHETTARTDGKGEATLKPLTPGYAGVEVQADGYAPATGFTTVGSAGAVGRLTITMHRGFAISGHVVDDTGKPVAKAHVSVGGFGGFERFEREPPASGKPDPNIATTDDKGQFSIRAVAAGTHILAAIDGEHAPVRSAPITVTDRAITGVQLVMKAGGVIAGTVVDATKKPVAYATVRVAGADEQMMQVAGRQATTDATGAFELRGVSRAKLQARAESESAASKLLTLDLTEKREARDLELVLDVTGTISGIVVDDKGAPVPEVQVSAFPDILGGESMEGMMLASMSPATTDGAGAFTITGLPDGAYRLWAARSTSSSGGWGRDHTSAKTGDKNVRITLAAAGGIKGTIVTQDGGGAPKLANVSVGWQAPTPAQDGAFEIRELAAGTYDVTFRGPDFAVTTKRDVKVEPGKTVDLGAVTVHRGRKVTGKVVDRKGQPIAGAKVKLGEMLMFSDDDKPDDDEDATENMGGIRSAVSDQDGRFSIIGVPAKATTLAADHPTAGRSVSVAILDGKQDPLPVTLTLRGFGSISGKVTQQGKPLANVAVTHSSRGGGAQLGAAETDDQGNFTMKKVPEGAVVLQVMQNKMMSMKTTTANTQVTAGKETKVTIDFPVGQVTLVVQIKAAAGHKVDAAQVFLFSGTALPANGKQLMDSFIAGGAQGMKFWFGEGKPLPEFDELVPGDYSICTIPITGDMGDPQFMQRINENVATLKVYCRKATVAAAPLKQTMTQEVPAMTPLPAPAN
ncbi:MAG: carboxypeptidase regulatory-like domain-containing protein [Deltaproteobacteria bacterium]|nr:carboxypeptidase regulatory-like domain-containing protein [Deltaproteobacteria bacterium]